MTDYTAIIPITIVALSAIAAMVAEAIRRPGERMPIAGFGLIGSGGAALASVFLWNSDAQSFGVIRSDNFALFINIVLCVVGVLTMLFSHDTVEREGIPAGEYYALLLFAIGLLAVGFCFKISAVPFHMWTPDAYEGAPTMVTAFMSTGVKAAAFGAFARVFLSPLEPMQEHWIPMLSAIAVAT